MKEPTIKDVAKRAGVSIGTVSRILNGAKNVKKSNLEKIQKAIEELGYRPNQAAKSLKSNKSHIIGIIVPNLFDDFYVNVITKVEQVLTSKGYLLVVLSSHNDEELERENINFLWEKRVDGIMVISTGQNEDLLWKIYESGTQVVFIDRKPRKNIFSSVYTDKQIAAKKATDLFIRYGHKKIALVTGMKKLISNEQRFNGYISTLYDNGIPINNDYIWFGDFAPKTGIEFMEWYVKQDSDNRPTAILSGSAMITYEILLGAKQYGIRIPDDISLISYGNFLFDKLIEPRITYISEFAEEIGEAAVELVLDKIQNPSAHERQVVMEGELIENDSVKHIE